MPFALLLIALTAAAPNRVVTRAAPPAKLTVCDPFQVTYVVTSAHPSLITGPLADSLGPFMKLDEQRKTSRRGDLDEGAAS